MNSTTSVDNNFFPFPSFTNWWEIVSLACATPYLFSILAFWIFTEQITYLKKKSILPGPTIILPFIGSVSSLIRDPTQFWFNQANYANRTPLGVSANYVIGRFMVFIQNTDLSHKVFANVRPDAFHLIGHPFGKKLFGEHNLIYMSGQDHKDMRRRIAPNFTPRALSTYAKIQQTIILRHLIEWERLSNTNPIPLRNLVRAMNLETSQTVFVGPYLHQEARNHFNYDYNLFNVGLMTLPIDLPGFAFRSARLAVTRLVHTLSLCVEQSKTKISSGVAEPTCLVDYWMQDALREENAASAAGVKPSPPLPTTKEIGGHLFDFLFAAQDASTSSLLWAITYLDSHPDVLRKVRAEIEQIWSTDSRRDFLTAEQLASMKYTQAVAREILRIRTPATLVTHIAAQDFPLTETYTIPKGAIVFPSVMESSFQGFPEPHRFEPERFLEGRDEEKVYKRNFLVFGAGPHQCVGQRYAINHLVLFIAMLTTLLDFKRYRTDGCDDIVYVPTICPKDDCVVSLSRRVAAYPTLTLPTSYM